MFVREYVIGLFFQSLLKVCLHTVHFYITSQSNQRLHLHRLLSVSLLLSIKQSVAPTYHPLLPPFCPDVPASRLLSFRLPDCS